MNHISRRQQVGAPTIADVAQKAGFSPMTVSRVINGEQNVREATRARVQAVIDELNYSPNLAARSLAGADQIRIGLIYSNPSAAYLSRFLLGSLEQARQLHIQLVIEQCGADPLDQVAAVKELLGTGVDGLIIPPPLCDSNSVLETIREAEALAVAVANWVPPNWISVVRIDDQEAAAAMTRHIISLGHRKIGFIVGNPAHKASEQRLIGFRAATAEAGLELPDAYIVQGEFTYRSGLDAAERLLDLEARPTAIFASNDDMAAATVAVAHRRQIDVPSELTVCGFDDTDFAQSIWPELTTIHQPIGDMSRTALDMLVEQVRARRSGKPIAATHTMLDYRLIARSSEGAPARA